MSDDRELGESSRGDEDGGGDTRFQVTGFPWVVFVCALLRVERDGIGGRGRTEKEDDTLALRKYRVVRRMLGRVEMAQGGG